ncbi:hypothetical protein BN2476_80086 [Paraburkholderia piptadeniae]|uniref:Uncharacterized protein n=1 Tax=Paraburkholderia piptadeniae TaxID=1701573 RepID=A0A1N7RM04_9BURK|nr:hypothetical protein BN2476_80086 [Paraburkholderia piptadeniae]
MEPIVLFILFSSDGALSRVRPSGRLSRPFVIDYLVRAPARTMAGRAGRNFGGSMQSVRFTMEADFDVCTGGRRRWPLIFIRDNARRLSIRCAVRIVRVRGCSRSRSRRRCCRALR